MDNIEEQIKEFRKHAIDLQNFIYVTQNKNLIELCNCEIWFLVNIFLDIVEKNELSKEEHENMRRIGSKYDIWK